jgi:hypothetical protein
MDKAKRKNRQSSIIPAARIERTILLIRGQKVLLDMDLARVYGVATKALNQAVKRNRERFPEDFMFRLTKAEKNQVVTNCDHLSHLKYSPTLPFAFTEHGAVMLASVLNTPVAVQASIQVVRAFVRLRQLIAAHDDLRRKIEGLEKKYDEQFAVVFDAIRQLMDDSEPEGESKPRIGYHSERSPDASAPETRASRKARSLAS